MPKIRPLPEVAADIEYDPTEGKYRWKDPDAHPARRKGWMTPKAIHPYFRIGNHYAYHLAWYIMTGEEVPSGMMIDHIDGDPTNDRWDNLRMVTPTENALNSQPKKTSRTGFRCVYGPYDKKSNPYQVYICGKYSSYHPTLEAAVTYRDNHPAWQEGVKARSARHPQGA